LQRADALALLAVWTVLPLVFLRAWRAWRKWPKWRRAWRKSQDREARATVKPVLPSRDDPRWLGTRGAQVAGHTCASCRQRIVVENRGTTCATCSEPLHEECAKRHGATAHAPPPDGPYR
jgi:hypothetical protein